MKKIAFWIIGLLSLLQLPVQAQENDSIRVSLMTCSPGDEIYELFGHTAIRVEMPGRRIDHVYNYGLFSFRTPNFVYRFVKGETDYQLGIIPYSYFITEYFNRGSYVVEQELNLSFEEKKQLVDLLRLNYQPENRTYRYNYFYDNCTTRARDKIEESIRGKVVYPVDPVADSSRIKAVTFREMVHLYTRNHPWDQFGIDLCLGAEADEAIDIRQQMFAPFFLMHEMDGAVISQADGGERPLVSQKRRVVDVMPSNEADDTLFTPMACALFILALAFILSAWELTSFRVAWWFDACLFALQGLAGCVIAFLFFFSIHPTVGSNYLLIIFNPIPLFYLPWLLRKEIKGQRDVYHIGNIAVLTLFIVFWWLIPQKIPVVILPLALGLLIRSVARIILTRK